MSDATFKSQSTTENLKTPSRTTCERVREIVRLQSQAKEIYKKLDGLIEVLVDSGNLMHGDEVFVDREHGTYIWIDQFDEKIKIWKSTACMRYVLQPKK